MNGKQKQEKKCPLRCANTTQRGRNARDISSLVYVYTNIILPIFSDTPACFYWEHFYDACPKGTKVILAVRDSDEVWANSWIKERFLIG